VTTGAGRALIPFGQRALQGAPEKPRRSQRGGDVGVQATGEIKEENEAGDGSGPAAATPQSCLLCGRGAVCSMADLNEEDKQQIAGVLKQVLELSELSDSSASQLAGEKQARQEVEARAAALSEEVGGLRAKLAHALDLLRAYQKRVREMQNALVTSDQALSALQHEHKMLLARMPGARVPPPTPPRTAPAACFGECTRVILATQGAGDLSIAIDSIAAALAQSTDRLHTPCKTATGLAADGSAPHEPGTQESTPAPQRPAPTPHSLDEASSALSAQATVGAHSGHRMAAHGAHGPLHSDAPSGHGDMNSASWTNKEENQVHQQAPPDFTREPAHRDALQSAVASDSGHRPRPVPSTHGCADGPNERAGAMGKGEDAPGVAPEPPGALAASAHAGSSAPTLRSSEQVVAEEELPFAIATVAAHDSVSSSVSSGVMQRDGLESRVRAAADVRRSEGENVAGLHHFGCAVHESQEVALRNVRRRETERERDSATRKRCLVFEAAAAGGMEVTSARTSASTSARTVPLRDDISSSSSEEEQVAQIRTPIVRCSTDSRSVSFALRKEPSSVVEILKSQCPGLIPCTDWAKALTFQNFCQYQSSQTLDSSPAVPSNHNHTAEVERAEFENSAGQVADLAEAELELLSMLVQNALSSRHKLSHTLKSQHASVLEINFFWRVKHIRALTFRRHYRHKLELAN
jgi:hypothetical protein